MRSGRFIPFIFFLGLLAGLGVAILFQNLSSPKEEELEETAKITEPDESGALLARIREQEQEIVRLRAEVSATPNRETPPPVAEAEPVPEPEPETRSGFAQQMENRMNRRVETLVSDYGLTDSQREQLEEAFRMRGENFRARRSGEDVPPFNLDDAIAGIMTEDQFAEYLEDSQEEIYNRAEVIAAAQLVRVGQAVEMDEGQQQLVYDTIHATAQESMIARQTGEEFNMRQIIDERLGTILSEEQLSAYRENFRREPPPGPPGPGP